MNIQQQIKEKENMIEKLKNEIEQLKKDIAREEVKNYQHCMGKYFKIDSEYYIKTKTIKDMEYCYCTSIFYDDTYDTLTVESDDIENLITLDHAEEITEQEFLNFINGKIMEIIK